MPRYTQPRKTWQYTQEFTAKAVQLSFKRKSAQPSDSETTKEHSDADPKGEVFMT